MNDFETVREALENIGPCDTDAANPHHEVWCIAHQQKRCTAEHDRREAEAALDRIEAVVEMAGHFDQASVVSRDVDPCWFPVEEIADEAGHVKERPCGKCEPCTLADLKDALQNLNTSKDQA